MNLKVDNFLECKTLWFQEKLFILTGKFHPLFIPTLIRSNNFFLDFIFREIQMKNISWFPITQPFPLSLKLNSVVY